MCRMSALAATALALVLVASGAEARSKDKDKAQDAKAAKPAAAAPAAIPAATKATPEERAMAQRLDPLARAAFWGREVDRDPRDVEAGVNLAQALRSMARHGEAVAAAQKTVVVNPTSVAAQLELARAYLGQGQGFYAIEPAKQAAALAPKDWRPVSLMAVAFEQAQRDDEALAAHRQALSIAENAFTLTNLAMFHAGHGNPVEAERLLRQAAARPDSTAAVRQNLALVLGLQGRLAEAEQLARQDLPPEVVANNMAYLRSAAGGATAQRSWDSLRATN